MIGDHHGRAARIATLLVRAVDEILGTHRERAVAIMTIQERESFLAEARVGVLGVAAGSGRGTVLVPVWYHYRPGR